MEVVFPETGVTRKYLNRICIFFSSGKQRSKTCNVAGWGWVWVYPVQTLWFSCDCFLKVQQNFQSVDSMKRIIHDKNNLHYVTLSVLSATDFCAMHYCSDVAGSSPSRSMK